MALGVMLVLYTALDAAVLTPERATGHASYALIALALLFGLGAWAMEVGGREERSPMYAGLALGTGLYGVLRLALG